MAIKIKWTLELPGATLPLEIKGMNGKPDRPVRTLTPMGEDAGGGVMVPAIDMYLFHSPNHELPRKLPPGPPKRAGLRKGDKAMHFHGYYELIGPPLPICTDVPETAQAGTSAVSQGVDGRGHAHEAGGEDAARDAMLGEEYTCILARALPA